MYWYIFLYRLLNLLTIITFILGFFALPNKDNKERIEIMEDVHKIIIIFLGLTLLIVFNPFYKIKQTDFHKEIAFSSGIFIITSSSLFFIIDKILPKIVKKPLEFVGEKAEEIETVDRVIKGALGSIVEFN